MNFTKKISYLCITGPKRECVGIVLVRKPIKGKKEFVNLANKYQIFGICSSKAFPRKNRYKLLTKHCKGWLHCFREPDTYLPKGVPRVLISESDFVGKPKASLILKRKKYDFIYICEKSGNQKSSKNWKLMRQCLPILCEDMGLTGIIVGMRQKQFRHKRLVQRTKMNRSKFLKTLSQSRSLIVPNIRDASPRIIPEALYMNIPVVVNRKILGGWKYINNDTGVFFDSIENVAEAMDQVLSKEYNKASKWFASNYGPINSGKILQKFLKPFNKGVRKFPYVLIGDKCK